MEIHKMLCLSTAHLSAATRNCFEMQTDDVPLFFPKSSEGAIYGWFLPIATCEEPPHTCPADLLAAINFAKMQGATWIMFDVDGPITADLVFFETLEA